ncbi:MAG: hypothetical protein GY807_13440 [Gammaproteobacteria bacterium]|nr:hypothetical protein [Gammaproteobacteria bacterium]
MIRKLTVGLGLTCLSLTLLLVLLLFPPRVTQLMIDPLRSLVLQLVMTQVSASLNGSVEIAKLQGSFLSNPSLRNIVVRDEKGVVLAEIDKLRLRYTLRGLFKGYLNIRIIEINRPRLVLLEEPDGQIGLIRALSPSVVKQTEPAPADGKGLVLNMIIEQARIKQGQVNMQLSSVPGIQTVEDIDLRLRAELGPSGLRFELQQLTAHAEPADISLKAFHGGLSIDAENMRFHDLLLQTQASQLTLDGRLPAEGQVADLRLGMRPLDTAEIGRAMNDKTIHGPLYANFDVVGPPQGVNIRGQLEAGDGRLDLQAHLDTLSVPQRYHAALDITAADLTTVIDRPALQSNLNMRLRIEGQGFAFADLDSELQLDVQASHLGKIKIEPSAVHVHARSQRVQIQDFKLKTSVARMTMKGVLDLAGQSNLDYQLRVGLPGLRQLLDVEQLDGMAQLQGQAAGPWPQLRVFGSLQAEGLRYEGHALDSIDIRYEAENVGEQPLLKAQLQALRLHSGALDVEGFSVNASYDVSAQRLRFDTELRQSACCEGKVNGSLTFNDNNRQLIVEALELRLEDHLWQSLMPLELDLVPQRITLKPFRLAHADESIDLGGSLDDGQLLGMNVRASNIELGFLGRVLSLPHLVQGQVDFEASLEGHLDDPIFQGNLTIKATPKQPQPFDLSELTLNYARGRLRGEIHAHQDNREVLAVDLNLPADLALIDKPVEQRLLDAPLNLHLEIKRPELSGFQRAMPDLLRGLGYIEEAIEANLALKRPDFLRFSQDAAPPRPLPGSLVGTLEGTLDLQGSYAKVTLDSELRLQQLGILGVIEGIQGEADLQGDMELAPTMEALRQGLIEDRVEPLIRRLRLRSRWLMARLMDGEIARDLVLRNLLLLANAALTVEGPWLEIKDLHGQLRFTGLPVTDLGLSARLTPEQLMLEHLKLKTAASELRGNGHMTLPGQQMQFRFDIPGLHIDEFVPGLATNLPSVVRGKVDIDGDVLTPQIAARLKYAGADINADFAMGLINPALPSYRAELSIDRLDTARLSPDLQGLIQASLKFQGEGLKATGRKAGAVLDIDSDGFNLVPDLKVRLRGNVTGSEVELAEFKVQSVPVDFIAQGVLSADQQTALVYNMNLGDLSPLQAFLGKDIKATGSISGEFTGSLEALRTQGTVYINDFHYAELKGEGLLGNFTIDNFTDSPQATLSARGVGLQAPSLPRSSLQLEVNHHAPRGDISLTVIEGPYTQSQLTGHFTRSLGLEFMIEHMHLHSGDWIWKNPVPITMVYDDQGSLRIKDLQLKNGEQRLSVEASLSKGEKISADVRLHDVEIRPAIHAFAPDADAPDGRLSLDLSLDGTLNEPGLQGSLLLSDLRKQNQSLGEVRARLSSDGTILNSDLRWQDQNKQLLQLNGTVDTAPAGGLDLQLNITDLNMSRLAPLSKEIIKSEGELSVDLRLAGTLMQPQVFGSMEIKNSQLQLAVTGENHTDIQSIVRVDGTRVNIESLHLGSKTGAADLVGRLEIAGLTLDQLDLSLKARDFTAMNTPAIGVKLSSDLSLRGSLQEMIAKGDIDIRRARIRLDNLPTSEARAIEPWELTIEGVYGPGPEEIERINGKISGPIKKDPLPFLRADVDVDIPRNAWVQGKGTAVEMKGELQLKKDLAGPFVIGGYVETLRGFASFLGKKFEIEKGRVTFTGTEEINPNLGITAKYKVSDYIVYVDVTGESKKPDIDFRSEPELDEADVISLLVFGRTTDRLSSSEESTLTSEAGQLAGSMAAGMLERTLGNTFGLDTIAVDLGDEDSGGSVGAGRYITQDLYLSYERTISDPTKENRSGNTVGIEYSVSDRLKVKGTSSDIGETALDFNWSFDY